MDEKLKNEIKYLFESTYGSDGELEIYFSPGRVNLIGEHTDYNGGYVFPCALDLGTYAAVRKRGDGVLRFASFNYDGMKTLDTRLGAPVFKAAEGWTNYAAGVVSEFMKLGVGLETAGADIYIYGTLPTSAGLSSSASLEMLVAVILNESSGAGLDTIDLIKLSQRAENNFVGVNCGIMDQFVIGAGREDNALLLCCRDLSYEYAALDLSRLGLSIVIANTNKIRGLADSKYNERRGECDAALDVLKRVCAVNYLADVTPDEFERHKHLLNETLRKRAEHVVYENERTKRAAALLKEGKVAEFGRLMNESHTSLRDLYEVTGPELDSLAAAAQRMDDVLGSRMTGAGFGGCTVSIIANNALDGFISTVGERYHAETGLTADFYIARTSNGTRRGGY